MRKKNVKLRASGVLGVALAACSPFALGQDAPAPPAPATTATTTGGTIHGTVKAGPVPLPGVSVTATNTLTGKKYATTTDINGAYAMTIPRTGRYVVRAELAAFAPATQEVRITAEATDQVADLGLELASRAAAQAAATTGTTATALASALGRGMQSLSVTGDTTQTDASAGTGNAGVQQPTLGGLGSDVASAESVAVTGQQGQTNQLGGMNEDEVRQRIEDAMAQARANGAQPGDMNGAVAGMLGALMGGGGFGGPGGGGGGRGGGGGGRGGGSGGFRGFNPATPHGAIFWTGSNSALNAAPFSVSGQPVANPDSYQNSYGVSFTGSPYIPGLIQPDTKQFVFFNVTGNRSINPSIFNGTVPTLAERGQINTLGQPDASVAPCTAGANFTGLTQSVNGVQTPTTIVQPGTTTPYANNTIPVASLSAIACNLLRYYPAPNVAAVGSQGYNYQTITTGGSNSTQASLRYVRNFGATPTFGQGRRQQQGNGPQPLRQNININGSYNHSASDNRNIFLPLGGASSSNGYGLNVGYTIGKGRFNNNASLNWNRSASMAHNLFTNTALNPETAVGITQPTMLAASATPFFNGLPSLSLTGLTGLSTATPSQSIGQTISVSDFVSYSHKRHNMRFGFDYRRVHADSYGGSNPLGTLTFSGYATGYSFADFLVGTPQASSIQASLHKIYLRENVYDWYVQDDFRLKGGITLNYGLRYEYFGPYSEKNNRLVNLDHNADFTKVDAVQPGQVGTYQGQFNSSLVNPDHTLYSPRFGFAYRVPSKYFPRLTKEMVVRGGYGLNFNTGQYATFARQLAFQPPFAITQTNSVPTTSGSGTSGCTTSNLTLTHPFDCSTTATQNNYSVNKDYRLGHVQIFNLGMQKTLPLQTVFNIDYNASVGGDLDIVRAPNRTATGLLDASAQPFNYEDSQGYSRSNILAVSLRKRQQKGISLQATYTYGHSLDNASSIGGSSTVVAQNDLNLFAEEGNSSFLTRHKVSGNWVIELPFGPNRAFLAAGGFWSKVLDGFNISGTYTLSTGTYNTPHYTGTPQEVASGASGSLRPNRNFGVPVKGPGHLRRTGPSCLNDYDSCWFNPAAFSAPAAGTYGTASRGDIEGPGQVTVSSALSRTVNFGGTRSFEGRVTASNVFNTVQYTAINTTLNSPTFGQVSGVGSRRALQFVGRFRF